MAARTRLTDIAEHAGVSTATVSRVLNGKSTVADATRRAVLAALDQLGYARPEKLHARPAGLIGLIVPELSNPVFPAFAQHIETGLSDAGYTPLLCTQSPGGTSEDDYIDMLVEHHVEGIVFVSGLHADSSADVARYERLSGLGIPYVVINGTNPKLRVPSFSLDNHHAMELAVRHLHSQGHRAIGMAVGQDRYFPTQQKVDGFRAAMRKYCGDPHPQVFDTLYSQEGGHAAAGALIDRGATAIVCGSDLMALGAIAQIRSRGRSVPEDVSVVGFDDSPLMAHTNPPLTTLRQPVDSMCRSAVTTLLSMISGNSVPVTEILFVPELIVRGSTGACRKVTA